MVHLQGVLAIQPSGRDEHCSRRLTVNLLLTIIVQYTITVTGYTFIDICFTGVTGEFSPS